MCRKRCFPLAGSRQKVTSQKEKPKNEVCSKATEQEKKKKHATNQG
jgi:hypothetical protein